MAIAAKSGTLSGAGTRHGEILPQPRPLYMSTTISRIWDGQMMDRPAIRSNGPTRIGSLNMPQEAPVTAVALTMEQLIAKTEMVMIGREEEPPGSIAEAGMGENDPAGRQEGAMVGRQEEVTAVTGEAMVVKEAVTGVAVEEVTVTRAVMVVRGVVTGVVVEVLTVG